MIQQIRAKMFENGEHLARMCELVVVDEDVLRGFAIENVHIAHAITPDDDVYHEGIGIESSPRSGLQQPIMFGALVPNFDIDVLGCYAPFFELLAVRSLTPFSVPDAMRV